MLISCHQKSKKKLFPYIRTIYMGTFTPPSSNATIANKADWLESPMTKNEKNN